MYKILATSEYIKNIKEISKKCKINVSLCFLTILIEVRKFLEANKVLNQYPDYLIGNYKCYKLRIKDFCGSKGKRGGYRFILGINTENKKIVFLTIYSKSQREDILDKEIEEILRSKLEEHNPCAELIDDILQSFNS